MATIINYSVPLHSWEFIRLTPLCTPLPNPYFPAPQVLQKFLTTCIKRKIIQPLDITLLSKRSFFSSAHKRRGFLHLVFRPNASSLQSVKDVLLGDYTGAVGWQGLGGSISWCPCCKPHRPPGLAASCLGSSLPQRIQENRRVKASYKIHHLDVGKRARKLLLSKTQEGKNSFTGWNYHPFSQLFAHCSKPTFRELPSCPVHPCTEATRNVTLPRVGKGQCL